VAEDLGVEGVAVEARRAAAEELAPGLELDVHLQAGHETQGGIVLTAEAAILGKLGHRGLRKG
jgi:hypothetical protein